MIKIEMAKETRKYINERHREYIEQTSLQKLEIEIKKKNKRSKFLKTLFGGTENRRRERLINFCLSTDLEGKIKEFEDAFLNVYGFEYYSRLEEHKKVIEETRNDLDDILDYEGFNVGKILRSGEKWNRHSFITSLEIKVCPYCNRQYITSYEDEEKGNRTTADADHYYPKAQYPILQMNVFNLVPSCNVCNSRMKGRSRKRHLYPYKDASDSLIFMIPMDIGDGVSEILIDTRKNKKAENSLEVFKLDKIYQAHIAEASEIKERAKEYFEFDEKAYEASYGLKVPFNVFNTWFSFMGKDLSAEPLIKLKQDVFRQLKREFEK